MSPDLAAAPGRRRRRANGVPRPLTPDYLERAALHYLGRFSSSQANLRRILERKASRCSPADGAEAMIEAVVTRLAAAGLVDDRAYGEAMVRRLRRRGSSRRQILARLRAKGLSAELCARLLANEDADADRIATGLAPGEAGDPELAAAHRFARRKRLGPYGDPASLEVGGEERARQIAAFGRAGFSYEVARSVVDSPEPP